MSTVEDAVRRLEQLKRAGVDFGESGVAEAANLDRATTARLDDVEENVPELVRQLESNNPPAAIPGLTRASAGSEFRRSAGRASRQIAIDLKRLEVAGMVTPEVPRSRIAEEMRILKRPLLDNAKGRTAGRVNDANRIMVTSALPGEGKSFISINLAISIAMEMDSTVLLIDADVAANGVAEALGMPRTRGLMDVLTNRDLDLADVMIRTNVPKLSLLLAGTPQARSTELLASDAMTQLVEEMASRYPDRILIFDSPPLLPTTEARVLASHMGQVLLVVEADRTTQGAVAAASAALDACPVVMTVLNKSTQADVGSYYGYGYGYGYGATAAGGPGKT